MPQVLEKVSMLFFVELSAISWTCLWYFCINYLFRGSLEFHKRPFRKPFCQSYHHTSYRNSELTWVIGWDTLCTSFS